MEPALFAKITLAALAALGFASTASAERVGASKDIVAACGTRDGWSEPAPPAHVYGNTWYVGTCGITVVLIETSAGLMLIDAGPEDAAEHVLASVRMLGFDPRQIKWLMVTHEHFDHAGGIAAIQKATGARLAVGPLAKEALRTGRSYPDDPQHDELKDRPMPPARVDRVLRSGGKLTLGGVTLTAHATPTHSRGSTSWTWQSCQDGKCLDIAFADSISTISSGPYRFIDHPQRVVQARSGIKAIAALPCEVLLTPHPQGSNLLPRLSGRAALVDSKACQAYAAGGQQRLAERLEKETAAK